MIIIIKILAESIRRVGVLTQKNQKFTEHHLQTHLVDHHTKEKHHLENIKNINQIEKNMYN